MFQYYHASPTVAFCYRALTLQLILPDEEKELEAVCLCYFVEGNCQSGSLRMLPVDGLVCGESYSVYAATLRADALRGGERLTYYFTRENEKSVAYSVSLTQDLAVNGTDRSTSDDTERAVPAILPLAPVGRIHLASGDLAICFAVAGKEIAPPIVYVKENGAFVPYSAEPNRQGAYAVKVPYASLARMERLEYYIEVKGDPYTATYGSADIPRIVRIKDNAGPAILSTYPAEGQAVEQGDGFELRLDYFDISGVNLQTSILCVDGRNVSAAAHWEADHVSYCPEKSFALGEHTFEVSLRDKLGNRTYQKVTFAIGDGTEGRAQRKKGAVKRLAKVSLIPLQAAKVIAGAFSTVKHLFSPKE